MKKPHLDPAGSVYDQSIKLCGQSTFNSTPVYPLESMHFYVAGLLFLQWFY